MKNRKLSLLERINNYFEKDYGIYWKKKLFTYYGLLFLVIAGSLLLLLLLILCIRYIYLQLL
jgi:hypothetical protein